MRPQTLRSTCQSEEWQQKRMHSTTRVQGTERKQQKPFSFIKNLENSHVSSLDLRRAATQRCQKWEDPIMGASCNHLSLPPY